MKKREESIDMPSAPDGRDDLSAEQAGRNGKARHDLRLAGERAARDFDHARAAGVYARLLALTPVGDLKGRFDLLYRRIKHFAYLGSLEKEWADIEELDRLEEAIGEDVYRVRLWLKMVNYFYRAGNYVESIACAMRLDALAATVEADEYRLQVYGAWSMSLARSGRLEEAFEVATRGLAFIRKMGARTEEAELLNALGLICLDRKDPGACWQYFDGALAIAGTSGNRELEGRVLLNRGNALGLVMGDMPAAQEDYRRAYRCACNTGDRPGQATALANLAWACSMQADFLLASTYQGQAHEIARQTGDRYQEAFCLLNLSLFSAAQGAPPAALDAAGQALELFRAIGDRAGEAWALLYAGHALLLFGQPGQALEHFRQSLCVRVALDQPALAMESRAGIVMAALALQDTAAALRTAEEILAYLAGGDNLLVGAEEPLRVYLACHRALLRAGDSRAEEVFRQATRMLNARVSTFGDEQARRMYIKRALLMCYSGSENASSCQTPSRSTL